MLALVDSQSLGFVTAIQGCGCLQYVVVVMPRINHSKRDWQACAESLPSTVDKTQVEFQNRGGS